MTLLTVTQTVVGREKSDLIDNTTYCDINCCEKGTK